MSKVRLLREGAIHALSAHPEFEVVDASAFTTNCTDQGGMATPDVFLIDGSILTALTRQGKRSVAGSGAKLVAYGLADEDEEGLVLCAALGATAFVSSGGSSDDLVAAIKSAVRGDVLLSAGLGAILLRRLGHEAPRSPSAPLSASLTQREAEIVDLMEAGLANKTIASRLGIELATVKNHIHNILAKFAVHRRRDAVAIARATRERARPDEL